MPFTVSDVRDMTQILALHPEWRAEVRRLVLTDELLALPEVVRELAEAQRRTEQHVAELAEAQRRTEQRIEELAEAQRRSEARIGQLEVAMRELAEAQRRTEQRVEELAEAQRRTEQRVEELAEAQRRTEQRVDRLETTTHGLVDRVSRLQGRDLERHYRERAGAYFGRWLWPVQALAPDALREHLEARLDEADVEEVMRLDVLVQGRARRLPGAPEVWLALEVSAVIDQSDVERARRRAALLQQAGYRAIPAVAGERLTEGAEELAQAAPIVVMRDGSGQGWEAAASAAGLPGPL